MPKDDATLSAASVGSVSVEKRRNKMDEWRWIPVTEQLPEFGDVIVVFKRLKYGPFCGAGVYRRNLNGIPYADIIGDGRECTFTHWQPFPSPPAPVEKRPVNPTEPPADDK